MGRGAKQKAGEESEAGCGFWWMQLTNFTQIARHRNPHTPIICVWEREAGGSGRRDQSILRSNLYRPGPLQMQRFGAGGGGMLEVMKCCQHVVIPTGAGTGKWGHCICLFIFYKGPGQRTHFGWRCLHLHGYPLGQTWWAAKTGCYFGSTNIFEIKSEVKSWDAAKQWSDVTICADLWQRCTLLLLWGALALACKPRRN